jgi:hypothetical protein
MPTIWHDKRADLEVQISSLLLRLHDITIAPCVKDILKRV